MTRWVTASRSLSVENSTAEDDGYVMALRHSRSTNLSGLCVFDAAHVPIAGAVVHLPARVPNGFHGNWVSSHQLTEMPGVSARVVVVIGRTGTPGE